MRTVNPSRGSRSSRRPRSRLYLLAIAGGALLVVTQACAPATSTTQVWSAELPARKPVTSVLVVGDGPGVADRRKLEDRLALDLRKRGVVARPSYELFPYAIPNHEQAREAALKAGIDGILSSRLKAVEERARSVPPTETYFWTPYFGSYTASSPGFVVADEVVEFSTTLWDARAGMTLWTASTRTENPMSSESFAGSLSKAVLPAMEEAGLVPREP